MVVIPSGIRSFFQSAFLAVLVLGAADAWSQSYYWNPSLIQVLDANKAWNWTETNVKDGSPRNYPASDKDDTFEGTAFDAANWSFIDSVKDGNSAVAVSGGRVSVSARGEDLWTIGSAPNFTGQNKIAGLWRKKAYKGNFDVSVKVLSQTNTHAWAKAGLIAWNDTGNATAGGAFSVECTPGNGWVEHYDSQLPQGYMDEPQGGNGTMVYPHWMRLVKQGQTFTAYYRTDSLAAWTKIRETRTPLATADSSFVGLFVTAHNTAATSTVVFDDFRGGGNIVSNSLDLKWTNITTDNGYLTTHLGAKSLDFTGYAGAFTFGGWTLSVSGNATFSPTMQVVPGTGRLALIGPGNQNLTPKTNDTLPEIYKSGAGEVVLLANPLRADSLTVTAGTFDLNSNSVFVENFKGQGGTLEGFTGTDDTLYAYSKADFSGLSTFTAGLGTVAIKAVGNGKSIAFNPGGKSFRNVTLWTHATGASGAEVVVGPGNLTAAGNLVFRNQAAAGGINGNISLLAHDPDVTVAGNVSSIIDGTPPNNWQTLHMGDGVWKVAGNVAFPLNGGGSDGSTLELTGGTGVTQALGVTGGKLNMVKHDAVGTVQQTAAFSATSLTLNAGTWDLNGQNVTLSGNLVADGTPNLLANLGGRSFMVSGNASFLGRTGAPLNLNPATDWTIAVAGTFTADYANVAGSNASGGTTAAGGVNAVDQGRNINWSFNGGPILQIPVVTAEPKDSTVVENKDVSFTVAASGPGLTYDWRRFGDPNSVGSAATLTLPKVGLGMNGALYKCIVSNTSGKDTTREAKLTVTKAPVPAKVTVQPLDVIVEAKRSATFKVGFEGDLPVTFAWRKQGDTAVIGQDSILTLPNLALDKNDTYYHCTVKNGIGEDSTRKARLGVVPTPVPVQVTLEPKDTTIFVTQNASFTTAATGSDPIAYAWKRKGDTTTVGTEPTLSFKNADLALNGNLYICIVTNAYGKDTTREAKLNVKPAPVSPAIVREPRDTVVKVGGKATFSVGVLGTAPFQFEWRKAGDTAVVGRDSVLTFDKAAEGLSGNSYYVVVSHTATAGKDTSQEARLTVRNCDSLSIQVSPGVTVSEGGAVSLWGKAVCADRFEWSILSGPAPRLNDPGVDTLAFKAPRISGDTSIRYQFMAFFGETVKSQEVKVTLKEAIPDPSFALLGAAAVTWTGAKPLVAKASVFNKAQLDLHTGYPLHYVWTLAPALADSLVGPDSLSLSNPNDDGQMNVILCLDNGGKGSCDTLKVTVDRNPISVARRGVLLPGGLLLRGSHLAWTAPGSVAVWSMEGRLLFEARGSAGSTAEIPAPAFRALRARAARLSFSP